MGSTLAVAPKNTPLVSVRSRNCPPRPPLPHTHRISRATLAKHRVFSTHPNYKETLFLPQNREQTVPGVSDSPVGKNVVSAHHSLQETQKTTGSVMPSPCLGSRCPCSGFLRPNPCSATAYAPTNTKPCRTYPDALRYCPRGSNPPGFHFFLLQGLIFLVLFEVSNCPSVQSEGCSRAEGDRLCVQ